MPEGLTEAAVRAADCRLDDAIAIGVAALSEYEQRLTRVNVDGHTSV